MIGDVSSCVMSLAEILGTFHMVFLFSIAFFCVFVDLSFCEQARRFANLHIFCVRYSMLCAYLFSYFIESASLQCISPKCARFTIGCCDRTPDFAMSGIGTQITQQPCNQTCSLLFVMLVQARL